jgi:hypothetical protein
VDRFACDWHRLAGAPLRTDATTDPDERHTFNLARSNPT